MKKTLLTAAALCLIVIGAQAQLWGFGPKAGVNFATVNGVEGSKVRTGVVAGVFLDRMVTSWFSIQTELLYSMNGFRIDEGDATSKVDLDYIKMPIVAKYYMMGGLNLHMGTQLGYLIKSNVDNGVFNGNVDSRVNKYNVDLVAGIAYDFNFGMILEGRYNIGITKTFNNISNDNIKNGTLQVLAAWRF